MLHRPIETAVESRHYISSIEQPSNVKATSGAYCSLIVLLILYLGVEVACCFGVEANQFNFQGFFTFV